MREELDKKLVEKYPEIFRNRHGDMRTTAMCWGFECGDGWYNIIDTLCGLLSSEYRYAKERYEDLIEWKNDKGHKPWSKDPITDEEIAAAKQKMEEERERLPVATQVKEKFGTLRFYVDKGDDRCYNLISFAESMSGRTCETCGKPGTWYPLGWNQTLCDEHADEAYGERASEYRNKTGEFADEQRF